MEYQHVEQCVVPEGLLHTLVDVEGCRCAGQVSRLSPCIGAGHIQSVSYTHLTLPTIYSV